MTAYYNENDPFAAAWLRNLIAEGLIANGEVDERSILDVRPRDLAGYTQHHFFAGIGGWSYALRLAAWPDHREVWTGSCPCQPFSAAGKRGGFADERHLWPSWHWLIEQCRPATVLGEQVSTAKLWLDRVYADLEAQGFAVGAADLPAACVGAKHLRYRTFFVANAKRGKLRNQPGRSSRTNGNSAAIVANNGAQGAMAHAARKREREQTDSNNAFPNGGRSRTVSSGDGQSLADAYSFKTQWLAIARPQRDPWSSEPAVGRVVDGVSHKLVEPILRGYGNAIVPQVAQVFIEAVKDLV